MTNDKEKERLLTEEEIWKEIPNIDDYLVSNHGRVKSLKQGKNLILKPALTVRGYLVVGLYHKGLKTYKVHQLVAMAFLGHVQRGNKFVINHKDFNRQNNHLSNLEVITQRDNLSKRKHPHTSKFVGVNWYKSTNRWRSAIMIGGKIINLGYYKSEVEASQAYQTELSKNKE